MIQTQPQKLTALPPDDELGARFCHWFNHGWHWIYAETPAPGEKAQWFTENRYPLQPRNLWQEYLDPEKIIGLRFDNHQTRYCLLDIDRDSPCHPANDSAKFKAVLAALEEIGLCRTLLIRSSDSEGIHIYYFLSEPVPTFALACAVRFALEDAGLQLRSGHLEIFPNTKAFSKGKPTDYNGHRLPLQVGSYWLDDDGQPTSDDLGQFLDAADTAAAHQDIATLQKATAAASKNRRRLRFTPEMSRETAEWKRHLEERIALGWTAHHQTNELLKDFATYGVVFLHLKGEALVDYVEATAKAAPGYEQWCRHQHEIRRRATERARSADNGFYVAYRGFPKRNGKSYRENFEQPQNNIVSFENQANANSRQQAAERIRQAMSHLQNNGMLPQGATVRAAAILATVKELTGKGMSLATLHQSYHLPLWHPGQKSPQPAQGETLHPGAPSSPPVESPQPAQGETLHPTPLYEGVGADGGQPHAYSVQGKTPIPPLEISSTPLLPSFGDDGGSPRDPVTREWHINCHTPTAPTTPAAPAASTTPAAPTVPTAPTALAALAAPSGSKIPLPSGASPETIRRVTKAWLSAKNRAENFVSVQALAENRLLDPDERKSRETIARMQYFWSSGEPELMAEASSWVAANPGLLPHIPPSTGADSASLT